MTKQILEKQNFLRNVSSFHKRLESLVLEKYDIEAVWTKVIAWGYRTVAIYMEDLNKNKYIIKITPYSKEKENKLRTSIEIEHFLKDSLPTAHYFLNNDNVYISKYFEKDENGKSKKMIVRLQKHIEGIPPFDMTLEIYAYLINYLKILHNIKPPKNFNLSKFSKGDPNNYVFLHGDLTPANALISYGKITGILDFEESMLGPIEYDLSRTMVFSWYYMKNESLKTIYDKTLELYKSKNMDSKLFFELAQEHLTTRLHNLETHKDNYLEIQAWKADKDFTISKLELLKKFASTI